MSNLPLETPTTAPAPVVYARKSQPILRPDPQIDIQPLAAETVADDSSTVKFVPLTPVQGEPTPKPQGPAVAGTSPEEGETDSRILNAALTALQNIHSAVGNESPRSSNRVLHLESKPLVAGNKVVGLADHGSRGGEIPLIPNSLDGSKFTQRRSIPLKKQQRFSCPNCQKAFLNEASLDAHVCNQSSQNSKTPKSEITKGKRKIIQAGRKPKMSDSYANLPSPSQVERGLPLKKRGRPVKHPLFVPSTAKAQPQKQLPAVVTNVTTPTHNSNPQTLSVPNGINKVNVEQPSLAPGATPQNSSEIIMDQSHANSGQRSQRKRNLPKWYENMVLDDNLMMGTAGRGNRTPVIGSPVAANPKLSQSGSSSEVATPVKPVIKLQKMDTSSGKPTEPPRKVAKSVISESLPPTKTSEMSPKLITPQKPQARIRRPPPFKDLDDRPIPLSRSVVKEVKTPKAVAKISPMKEVTPSDNVTSLAAKSNGSNSKGSMDQVQSNTSILPTALSTIQPPDLTLAITEIDVNNTAELSAVLTEKGEHQTASIEKSERKLVCTPNLLGDNSYTAPGQKIVSPSIQNNSDTIAKSTPEAAPTLKPQKVSETPTIVKITGINSGHITSSITTTTTTTTPQIQKVSESQKKINVKALPATGKGKPTTIKRSDSNRMSSDQTLDLNSNGSVKQVVLISAPKTPQPILKTTPSLSVSSSGPTTRKRKLEDDNNESKPAPEEEIPKTDANGAKKSMELVKRTRQSIVATPPIKKSQQMSKPISEIKHEKNCGTVEGTTTGLMNGFGCPITPGLSQSFAGMPRLQNQSGLPIMEDSDNSSDDEDPTSTATPNSSRSGSSRPYIKDTVIRFLENKISNRNMLRIREELMTLKQSGNYFKLTKTAPMAAGLVHDMFCQYFGTHDAVEDEMQ